MMGAESSRPTLNYQQNEDGSWSPAFPLDSWQAPQPRSWWRRLLKNTLGRLIRHG